MPLHFAKAFLASSFLILLGSRNALSARLPNHANQRRQTTGALNADEITKRHFGNDAAWYRDRIPIFDSSDSKLNDVYYYRWSIFRAHQRDLGERGYISTEFIDDVSWQLEPWASLNDATGFHVGEGRWSRDPRFANDYLTFMYTGGNDRHFTDYMADTAYSKYLVDGDQDFATSHLDAMLPLFNQWSDHLDPSKGIYYVEPLLDATEYTISSIDASGGKDGFRGGDSFRPSINSYMYANARAIARISELAGNAAQAAEYDQKAEDIKMRVQNDLWNSTFSHFIDRFKVDNEFVKYYDPIRGRELVGLVPWQFSLPDDNKTFSAAWSHILSENELKGSRGLRTAEPSYEYYMRQYRYEGSQPECQWNGPVWPYQTTQVLLGLANLVDSYEQVVITKSDYLRLLREYAQLHYQGDRLDLEENYYPDTGAPIVGLARSHHYFHSGFVDLILSGLVGIRPQADDTIVVNPMVDDSLGWFRVDNILYHGRSVSVLWDVDGSHYGQGAGLHVYVDGQQVAQSAGLARLTANVERRSIQMAQPAIAQTIQLVRNQAPFPNASSNTNNSEGLHEVLDGRIWFYPEPQHGWTSKLSTDSAEEQWLSIDFGNQSKSLSSAEIAFFADRETVQAPTSYKLQQSSGNGEWTDISLTEQGQPVSNGITICKWNQVETSQIRLVFQQTQGKAVRVIELKAF